MKSVAVVASLGLGDAFLSLILGKTIERLGNRVTLYSSALHQLRSWIPWAQVRPFETQAQMERAFEKFDAVVAAARHRAYGKAVIVGVDRSTHIITHFENYLRRKWGEPKTLDIRDLDLPSHLVHRRYPKRVILNPTSSNPEKNWPLEKFVLLSQRLLLKGFEPILMVSPEEEELVQDQPVPYVALPLEKAAGYLYESGYFIGNDSGPGHMASFFHIPTLSLFARRSFAKTWRPGFFPGLVVVPTISLPGARLKERFWKSLLTVGKVEAGFQQLLELNSVHEKKE